MITKCEVPDAIKALTFILYSTVVNAMVNDHVNAIKGMTNELDAEAGKLCVSDISMKRLRALAQYLLFSSH